MTNRHVLVLKFSGKKCIYCMILFVLRAAGGAALCGVAGEADTCGNVHVDNDGVMAISSVDPSDSGYYMCSVTDSENELTVKKIFRVRVIGL